MSAVTLSAAIPAWTLAAGGIAVAMCALALAGWVGKLGVRHRRRFIDAVTRRTARLGLFVDPVRLLWSNLAVVAASCAVAAVLTGNLAVTALAAVCAGFVPRFVLEALTRRRRAAFRAQLPDLMMITAGALRGGLGLAQALAQSAHEIDVPARQEVELMLREQRLGATFEQALAGLERRMPLEETALVSAAMRISRETGGNLAETLESLADAMRRKIAIEGKIRALTAQGRLQGWAMGLLPLACAGLLWLVEPFAMRALVTTWYGAFASLFVAIMQVLGLHFVRRVTRIDV